MRRIIGLLLSVLILPSFTASGHDGLKETFQEGLFHEEAEQDLTGAIEAYQSVLKQHEAEDRFVATAVFRLGECYRKQGNKEKAAEQYQRLLREYPQQKTLVELSRQNLSGMGHSVPSEGEIEGAGSVTSTEAKRIKELKEMVRNSPDLINALGEDGKTPLQKAAAQGRLRVARFLVDNGADLVFRGRNGMTALHMAALNGHKAMAELLISEAQEMTTENKAVDPKDTLGRTPLHLAAYNGHRIVGEVLIKNGANVDARMKGGNEDSPSVRRALAAIGAHHEQFINSQPNVTPLHLSGAKGFLGMVELLVNHGANIGARERDDHTPLLLAVMEEHLQVAQFLLKHGAKMNVPSVSGRAAWPLAVDNGIEWTRLFLDHGADPDSSFGNQLTPLMMATDNEDRATVSLLLKKGGNPDQTAQGRGPLHVAVQKASPKILRLLLDHGVDTELENEYGWTPLQVATYIQTSGEVCELLLRAGANPDVVEEGTNETPLHWALGSTLRRLLHGQSRPADSVDEAIASLLLRYGASVNAQQNAGNTALHLATLNGSPAILERVLQEDPDLKIRNEDGWTPLEEACFSRHPNREKIKVLLNAGANPDFIYPAVARVTEPSVIKMLINAGGEVDVTFSMGTTPLHMAARNAVAETVKILLAAGATVNAQDEDGWSPLHQAVEGQIERQGRYPGLSDPDSVGLAKSIDALLAAGADPNAQTDQGETALHLAIPGIQHDVKTNTVKHLLKHGANPNIVNNEGMTPLRSARSQAQKQKYDGLVDLIFSDARGYFMFIRRDNTLEPLFFKGLRNLNRYTVIEAVAELYTGQGPAMFPFPDLSRVKIHQVASNAGSDGKSETVDLISLLNDGKCDEAPCLEWGDIIEIPESDHRLEEKWQGFPDKVASVMEDCLRRKVTLRLHGETHNLMLGIPRLPRASNGAVNETTQGNGRDLKKILGFRLRRVIDSTNMLRSSSDLSRVTVTRQERSTGKTKTLKFDLTRRYQEKTDLWLRNGDVIHVPERPGS